MGWQRLEHLYCISNSSLRQAASEEAQAPFSLIVGLSILVPPPGCANSHCNPESWHSYSRHKRPKRSGFPLPLSSPYQEFDTLGSDLVSMRTAIHAALFTEMAMGPSGDQGFAADNLTGEDLVDISMSVIVGSHPASSVDKA